MLVLSRKKNESIVINDNISIMVIDIRGDKVRLGIEAPKDVPVHRQEVYEAIQRHESPAKNGLPGADASKLAGMTNSYLFDIEGEGQWAVAVRDGGITVSEGGGAGDPDATISTSSETFEQIVAGNQNPTTAYMTGKLKIKGDMGAAMKLQKLFG